MKFNKSKYGRLILTAFLICSGGMTMMSEARAQENIYAFKMTDINGYEQDLSQYQGKVLLVVNTASKCGLTPQYASLQKLYETYQDRGFEVLAFPANNFGGQEPGTDAEIKEFCNLRFQVRFPLFSKISVKGTDIHPLYNYLTTQTDFKGDIEWNFAKFLIAPGGEVVARFPSRKDPLDGDVRSKIEEVLPA